MPHVGAGCLGFLLSIVAGCGSLPRATVERQPPGAGQRQALAGAAAAVDTGRGEFAIPASMLDTWNAVGQLLVRTDGVTYEGRAQMLGIYVVRYRGEKFLILTRALVMRAPTDRMETQVGAVRLDGKPNDDPAAIELLGLLQARLPAELARIAAGER